MNLDPEQFKNLLLPKQNKHQPIVVSVQARFIADISSAPPEDPEHRLTGFESDRDDLFYIKVINPKVLTNSVAIESLVYHLTRHSLRGDNQGVQLVDDPLG